jgi:hypothetical protein
MGLKMVVRLSPLIADLPLPPVRFLVLVSIRGRVHTKIMVELEGLGELNYSVS